MTNATPVSQPAEEKGDETLSRLRAYIGPNWDSHYETVFRRLMAERQQGVGGGRTWNWPAILPAWWLYRRLYGPFAAIMAVYLIIYVADIAIAGSIEGGSLVALLNFVPIVLQGFLGDKLLFSKASEVIQRERKASAEELEALGRPLRWVVWVPLAYFILSILSAIVLGFMLS
jgi:hypothetical protein